MIREKLKPEVMKRRPQDGEAIMDMLPREDNSLLLRWPQSESELEAAVAKAGLATNGSKLCPRGILPHPGLSTPTALSGHWQEDWILEKARLLLAQRPTGSPGAQRHRELVMTNQIWPRILTQLDDTRQPPPQPARRNQVAL